MRPFRGSFTLQEPIPEAAIALATEVMRSGGLHRYGAAPDAPSLAARLEAAFAEYQGARYCLAVASGGYAMSTALRALGVGRGDVVLTNGFTLAPVPGAIAAVGAEPALVEITPDLVLDLDDLDVKIARHRPRALLLSNMRGHMCDMEALVSLLARTGTPLIEDCAHTMGAAWNGRKSGAFGLAGCFSTQTYKHLNSGEGGLITSDDPAFMARAILLSGSYMLYERHGAAPPPEAFAELRLDTPNMSGRMDELRAAVLLPQLERLDANAERWRARHDLLAARLVDAPGVEMPRRSPKERHVGSSFQFRLPGAPPGTIRAVVADAAALGVELKWFGDEAPAGYTSAHASWRYLEPQSLPRTDAVLAGLLDMRVPLTFSLDDCAHIAEILSHVLDRHQVGNAA